MVAQSVELARARAEITRLRDEVAELKRRLGMNSGNSSMPPSSDRFSRPAPKSLRGKTNRKQGKQPGAPGASLSLPRRYPSTNTDRSAAVNASPGRPGFLLVTNGGTWVG